MKYYNNILETIGRTPLVKLNHLVEDDMATILAKVEFFNPGGAVKDRMAAHIIATAEKKGLLKPGATIVENTSGNTGVGLAMAAAVKGYRCIFTMPDKMSTEKINMLKAFGAKVIVTPTDVAHDSPDSYYETAKRIARETPNSFYVDQYYNEANIEAHYLTTGPEIWEDTEGKIDYLIAGASTGGTITGTGRYLKEKAKETGKEIKIICPDPEGSIFYDVFYKNEDYEPRVYKVEGIGNDVLVGCLDMSVIDDMYRVSDRDTFITARQLTRKEGIFAGGSSGSAVWTALKVAKEAGPEKTVVVILPDSGSRYISKFFSDAWMRDLGYLDLDQQLGTVKDLLAFKGNYVEFASSDETISDVTQRMSDLGISQMPVKPDGQRPARMVHESDLLQGLLRGELKPEDKVSKATTSLHGEVKTSEAVSQLQKIFDANSVAIAVDNGEISGIITKIDLVKYLTARS